MADNDQYMQNGLEFACQPGCAACCKIPGWVEIDEQDAENMAATLQLPLASFYKAYTTKREKDGQLILLEEDDHACVMLDADNRCKVHDVRPLQCRTYPFWPEVIANEWTWQLEQQMCPGVGIGRLYSYAEVQAIRNGSAETGGYDAE